MSDQAAFGNAEPKIVISFCYAFRDAAVFDAVNKKTSVEDFRYGGMLGGGDIGDNDLNV